MSPRTLVFVNRRSDVGRRRPETDVVVLDTSWTPRPGERPDVIPIRATAHAIVARVNLFDESLERLDEWAEAADLPERFKARDVTWWFHARGFIRLKVHELLFWRYVLDELAPPGRYQTIVVPRLRRRLVAASVAAPSPGEPAVAAPSLGEPAVAAPAPGEPAVPAIVLSAGRQTVRDRVDGLLRLQLRPRARRLIRRLRRRDAEIARRVAVLHARIDALAAEPGSVLAVVQARSFHVIGDATGRHRGDPYVGPVLDRLDREGHPVVTVALGLSHRRDADWEIIERDDRIVPLSIAVRRWRGRRSGLGSTAVIRSRLTAIPRVPLEVGGFDVGPDVRAVVVAQREWLRGQQRMMALAEGLLGDLRPRVMLTGWEAARTSWLGAARHLRIPIVAVQHGVIYPKTPDYCRPEHPALVRPDVTCVFGPYERDLLIEQAGYAPASVVVTGSPRADPLDALVPDDPDERAAVRRELGVAPGNRLLVVSTARHTVGDLIHSMAMVGRLLDGPLPGVHVTFKLHPEEQDGTHYLELLAGLARAGGYPPLLASAVRDIDIYRLLRAADAHLGQYSTVLTDAVLTSTPNMIGVGQAWSDLIGYVPAGVAVPVRSVDDVRAFMADPLPPTIEDRARFLDAHYAPGDAAGRIAVTLLELARS